MNKKTQIWRSLLVIVFVTTIATSLSAQVCDGYLGVNIFEGGNFGSGADNIVQVNPNIAPGYTYTTNPPPPDGTYIITNDINKWSNGYDWLKIQDNSTDPNGYMMVVNASYQPGLFFILEVTGLCENTQYQFSADIINLIPPGNNYIKPKIKFLLNNVERFNTGDVAEDGKWHSYAFSFSTSPGQTSVILKMENNAPGGIGNDLAIDNIAFRPCGPKASITPKGVSKICAESFTPYKLEAVLDGDQYKTPFIQWQSSLNRGFSWTDIPDSVGPSFHHNNSKRNYYYYRYLVGNSEDHVRNSKCRVASNTKVVEVLPTFYSIADTICNGVKYQFGGKELAQSGIYVDSLTSAYGCDSIVLLELYVDPDINIKASFAVDNPSCDYLEDGMIDTLEVVNGMPPLEFYLNGDQGLSSRFIDLGPGNYAFKIMDRIGCVFDTTLTLVNPKPFVVDIEPDWSIKLGQKVEIQTESNYPVVNFNWSSPEVNCIEDCSPMVFYPSKSMVLSLEATSDKGCLASDKVTIDVEIARSVFIPTAFSPNKDGFNDIFNANTIYPQVKSFDRFEVYNRWGQLVFEANGTSPVGLQHGWDGSDAAPGVYAYYIEARFLDDVVLNYRGTLHLLR